ncbi:hypothetical protein T484DRAFT_1855197, partial [Baffinella frigidus]
MQDYNWEYPQTREDWMGLKALLVETKAAFKGTGRAAFKGTGRVITMAYYPDTRQERLLADLK